MARKKRVTPPAAEPRRGLRFGPVVLEQAEGKILGHNVAGREGRLALRKRRRLGVEDVALLRGLGRASVYVAVPGDDDVGEDRAALRIAEAGRGPGLSRSGSRGRPRQPPGHRGRGPDPHRR